ncbi:MAG: type II secretion system protein M [Rhodocyclaceae bacterium]|jgi:type II secretory pathway component PulM|nr:type II secretion system protein M [Rhodocyclaceae bacterium]
MKVAASLKIDGQSIVMAYARKRWESAMAGRTPRERLLIGWGTSIALAIVIIFAIWLPLKESQTRLTRVVELERKNLATMLAIRRELKAPATAAVLANDSSARGSALLVTVEASARAQLNPSRLDVKLDGDSGLTIQLSNIKLSRLLGWIDSTVRGQRLRLEAATLRSDNSLLSGELRFTVAEP